MFRLLRTYRKTALGIICTACTLFVILSYLIAVGSFAVRYGWFHIDSYSIPWVHEMVRAENWTLDLRARYGRHSPKSDEFVYLSIDQPSIRLDGAWPEEIEASRALTLMSQGWPFNREVYGHIIEKVMEAGAKAVVLDLIFAGPKEGDDYLKAVLDKYRDRVVVGGNFVNKDTAVQAGVGGGSEILQLPDPGVMDLMEEGIDPRIGFVNFFPNNDGVIRTAMYYKQPEGSLEPIGSMAARAMQITGRGSLVPKDRINGVQIFRFTGPGFTKDNPQNGFQPLSVFAIFVPSMWEAPPFKGGELFKDKIVLLGPDGNFLQDEHLTPFGLMRGPEIHLNSMNALLNQDFLEETPFKTDIYLILFGGVMAWALLVLVRSPLATIFVFIGATIGYLALALYYFNEQALYILVVPPLVAFNFSGIVGGGLEFWMERKERARTRATLERFVSKDIVREVMDARESFYNTMGGARRCITVLFSDVRGFTTYTEVTPGDVVVKRLNEYLTEMSDAVLATNGTLDKFIGDAVMAVWGNIPVTSTGPEDEARRAVEAAISMRRKLEALNQRWKADSGFDPWAFGIGIHQGEAIVGSIGASKIKEDPTIIGDTVNTGARLESYTKQYKADLLISETVAPHIEKDYVLRPVDKIVFKGKTKALEIFTVVEHRLLPMDPKRQELLAVYEEGIKLFRPPSRDFAAALAKFEAGLAIDPSDALCALYIGRSKQFLETPPPADWQGEEVAKTK